MAVRSIDVPTPDGPCRTALHTPSSGAGPWPAVILLADAGGVRSTFSAMADRLAELGYAVALPDLYHRHGDWEPFDGATAFTDPDERTRLFSMASSVTLEGAMADIGAVLDALADAPEVADGPVGTTGYCMGGRLSLLAAGRFPDVIGAAASFHGGWLVTDADDSPHLLAGQMTARLYVAGAAEDSSFDDEQFERLAAAFEEADLDHTVVTYPAAHGFAVADNPTFDEAASERHWAALEDLYAAALQPD